MKREERKDGDGAMKAQHEEERKKSKKEEGILLQRFG